MAFTYPLPDYSTDPAAVEAALDENQAALTGVVASALGGVQAGLDVNQGAVAGTSKVIARAVNKSIKQTGTAVGPVVSAVNDGINAALAQSQSVLSTSQAAAATAGVVPPITVFGYCVGGQALLYQSPQVGLGPLAFGPGPQADGQRWQRSNPCATPPPGGGQPSPPVTPPSPPVTPPSPPVTPPVTQPSPPITGVPYYVECAGPAGPTGTIAISQTATPQYPLSGPYPTVALAVDWLDTQATSVGAQCNRFTGSPAAPPTTTPTTSSTPCAPCPTTTTTSTTPTTAPTAPACSWDFSQPLPAIGGPQWCQAQESIAVQFAALGNGIISSVLGMAGFVADVLTISPSTESYIGTLIKPSFVAAIVSAINQTLVPISEWAKNMVACWQQLATMAPQCQPGTLLGVVVFRGVIQLLRKWRIGTDAGVWATLDLSLDLPQLDRAAGYIIESLCPSIIPSPAQAWHAHSAGFIDRETYRCWASSHGEDIDLWQPVRDSQGHAVGLAEVMRASALGYLPPDLTDHQLRRRGWTRPDDRRIAQLLYQHEPLPAELQRWAADDVLDQQFVNDFALLDGFANFWTSEVQQWHAAAGHTLQRAQWEYASRRNLPSEGQLREYLHRLGRLDPTDPAYIDTTTVQRLLEASNLPPRALLWAMQTLYRPRTPGDVSAQILQGVAGQADLVGSLLDTGYSVADAGSIASTTMVVLARQAQAITQGWTLRNVATTLRAGLVDEPTAQALLVGQGYALSDIQKAVNVQAATEQSRAQLRGRTRARSKLVQAVLQGYAVGTVSDQDAATALAAAGYDAPSATVVLQATEIAQSAKDMTEVLRLAKKGYLRGEFDATSLSALLANSGLSAAKIAQLSTLWGMEKMASAPTASVGAIQRWVASGLLTIPQAQARLAQLGWTNPDLALMTAALKQQLTTAQQKAATQKVQQLQRLVKQAALVKQQALRALERAQPLSALATWYRDGIMSKADVTTRMLDYGYDQSSIDLYIRGWDYQAAHKKSTALAPAGNRQPTQQQQQPISRLRAWWLDGIIDSSYVTQRLTSYGLDATTIALYIAEWQQQLAYRQSKSTPPAPV